MQVSHWGYKALAVSVATGQGLPELADALKGKLSAVIGPSGVGKSSIINALRLRHQQPSAADHTDTATASATVESRPSDAHTLSHAARVDTNRLAGLSVSKLSDPAAPASDSRTNNGASAGGNNVFQAPIASTLHQHSADNIASDSHSLQSAQTPGLADVGVQQDEHEHQPHSQQQQQHQQHQQHQQQQQQQQQHIVEANSQLPHGKAHTHWQQSRNGAMHSAENDVSSSRSQQATANARHNKIRASTHHLKEPEQATQSGNSGNGQAAEAHDAGMSATFSLDVSVPCHQGCIVVVFRLAS